MNKDGGPAFPRATTDFSDGHEGMSLRDWFAGRVIPTLLADFDYTKAVSHAYTIADLMIAERDK